MSCLPSCVQKHHCEAVGHGNFVAENPVSVLYCAISKDRTISEWAWYLCSTGFTAKASFILLLPFLGSFSRGSSMSGSGGQKRTTSSHSPLGSWWNHESHPDFSMRCRAATAEAESPSGPGVSKSLISSVSAEKVFGSSSSGSSSSSSCAATPAWTPFRRPQLASLLASGAVASVATSTAGGAATMPWSCAATGIWTPTGIPGIVGSIPGIMPGIMPKPPIALSISKPGTPGNGMPGIKPGSIPICGKPANCTCGGITGQPANATVACGMVCKAGTGGAGGACG
mmetsp:Transcript_41611/g.75468  ORF Transcript_41611/g.75468 Transcript_41611/m.75468 type:complete len:284 (-) Transcript_41611:582-1433(-)